MTDMKKKNLLYVGMASLLVGGIATSCESGTNEFENFDYSTVYFANQFAERTLVLGEDEFTDNAIDNEHKVSIKAAWGGGYNNPTNVTIDFEVDESLCDNLYFIDENRPVVPMPAEYYTLASNQIHIPEGQIGGGVEVQLTDAFFADEHAIENYYAIPLRMLHVEGADSILQGTAGVENPVLTNSNHWTIRRGIDQMTANGATTSNIRHEQYIEDDEVVYLTTNSLSRSTLALTTQDTNGKNVSYNIALAFGEDGNCTLSSITDGITVSGTGKFIKDGEKNSLGGKDRDALYLDYQVDFHNLGMQYATKDTLVLRTRGVQGGKAFNAEVR